MLYNTEILRLATSIPHVGRLAESAGTSERRSKTCGSKIIVDVNLDEAGRVTDFAQTVSACALGQASAALLGMHVIGKSADDLAEVKMALAAFLAGSANHPGDWPGLEVFANAVPHHARHAAILLPFEAAAEAADRARQ